MEQDPNSTEEEEEALTRKLHELLAESDTEETEKFCFQEEMIEEVMQELYKEITFSTCHAPPNPPIFFNDAKNGSCGALVSSSAYTTLAEVEVVSFPVTENVSTAEMEKKMEGFDDEDHLDCEWVGRVLRNWWF